VNNKTDSEPRRLLLSVLTQNTLHRLVNTNSQQ